MRRFKVPGSALSDRIGFSRGERRKLVAMTVGLVLVVIALRTGWQRSRELAQRTDPTLPAEGGMVERVFVPAVDAARVDALVSDADARGRVVLERPALQALLADARRMTPASFEALGIAPLDAAARERLLAEPEAARGRAFRARGEVLRLETRRDPASGEEENLGLLALEDGGRAWFLTPRIAEGGGFLRVDGLFLKVYRAEESISGGAWVDAPLLVAPRAERSYPELGPVHAIDAGLLAQVEDDVLFPGGDQPPRVSGLPFDALWNLMAYARDLAPGAVDWERAPELDRAALVALLEDGAPHRGEPYRVPLSRLQGVRVKQAGENPARLSAFTEGWIGNAGWQYVVHFKCPDEHRELALADYVVARGFFLKDFAYEAADGGLRVAPVLVLADLEEVVPREDPLLRKMVWVASGVALALIAVFVALVRRDRVRSKRLAQDLLQRKRRRRERARTPDGTPEPRA